MKQINIDKIKIALQNYFSDMLTIIVHVSVLFFCIKIFEKNYFRIQCNLWFIYFSNAAML